MKINKIKFMITIFIFLVICLLGMHISNASYTSYDIKGICLLYTSDAADDV